MTAQRNVRGAGARRGRRFMALVFSLGALVVVSATAQAQTGAPTGATAAAGGRAGSSAARPPLP